MNDPLFTETEKMLQAAVREFAERELVPKAKQADEREEFSWDIWHGMASLGLTGIGIDPSFGGSGGGYREMAIVVEEVARGDASASVSLVAHLSLGTHTIYKFSNDEQKRRLVPALARGDAVAAWALTEPGSGSDAAALQTTAELHGQTYLLNGNKTFITNGDLAQHIVVFATSDKSLKHKGIGAFLLEKGSPGFQSNRQQGKMGMRGSTTADLILRDAEIRAADMLGERNSGFNYAMDILDSSRIIIAAQCVGIAQAAFEAAATYANQRQSFGKVISEHQAIQFMLAEMATDIHASRTMTRHAAILKDNNLPFINEASMAKLFASEAAQRVTSNALQIFGGYGYFKDLPVERYFRDARVTTIYEGTSEVQRLLIARHIKDVFAS